MSKILDYIEKNRWMVILPLVSLAAWLLIGIACTPSTQSPIRAGVQVNAAQLELDYRTWLNDCNNTAQRFEFARQDIARQVEAWNKLETSLMSLASGSVTSWPGLLQLVFASGAAGLFADNIRKNGVIAGLKRNKAPPAAGGTA